MIRRISAVPLLLAGFLAVFAVPMASADNGGIPIGVTYGAFYPVSASTVDHFGNGWTRFSIGHVNPRAPKDWRPGLDFTSLQADGPDSASIYAVNYGVTKGIGPASQSVQPYVSLGAGPFLADVDSLSLGVDTTRVGLNVAATAGLIFSQRFFVEARFDYFTEVSGIDFNGITLQAGIRVFDLRL